MKKLHPLLVVPLLFILTVAYQSGATTYIWGVGPKIVVIDDGRDIIINGPPPKATPGATPGPPKKAPTTPGPKATPKPSGLTAYQHMVLAGNAHVAASARRDAASAMAAALAQSEKSYVLRVAQIWAVQDPAGFERWCLSLDETAEGRALRKLVSLALPAAIKINPEQYREHPDFPQIAQTWAVFESEHDPAHVRQFATTVDEPLRGLLHEIVQKTQP